MTALSQINDVDSFITFDANFGDVHYMSSSYINPVTRRHDYVPEIVSSIVSGSEYLLKTLPIVLRRMAYTQRSEAAENEPQVLTVEGVLPLSEYTFRLAAGNNPMPTLALPSHSLVPRKASSGLVDLDGLAKMGKRIAQREVNVQLRSSCCTCFEQDVDLDRAIRYRSLSSQSLSEYA